MTFTKTADEVFAPTNISGAPRGMVMGEASTWETEVEEALAAIGQFGLTAGSKFHSDTGTGTYNPFVWQHRMFLGGFAAFGGSYSGIDADTSLTAQHRALHDWAIRDATLAVDSQYGSMSIVGHTQTSKRTGWPGLPTYTPAGIGVAGFSINDVTSGTLGQSWGGYFEAVRFPGGGFTVGAELGTANLGALGTTMLPNNVKTGAAVSGVSAWVQAGLGLDVAGYADEYGEANHIAAYMAFLSSYADNSIRAVKGIVFAADSLLDISGTGALVHEFMTLPPRYQMAWYNTDNTLGGYVWYDGSAATSASGISLGDAIVMVANNGVTVPAKFRTAALLSNYANDAAAASGGIAVNQFYRNGSVVMQRVA